MNVVEEIVEIRERLARMEGSIEHLVKTADSSQKQLKQIPKEAGGNIVVPVAAVVVLVNLGVAVIDKFF